MKKKCIFTAILVVFAFLSLVTKPMAAPSQASPKDAAKPGAKSKTKAAFTLEEFTIEGKLKKPQMVLISADERPRFQPMAINTYTSKEDLLSTVDRRIFEYELYQNAFPVNP
jgi:hypothetical protein